MTNVHDSMSKVKLNPAIDIIIKHIFEDHEIMAISTNIANILMVELETVLVPKLEGRSKS